MVKFLSGNQFSSSTVPLCTFWRDDVRTDPDKELSSIEGTGKTYSQQGKGQNSAIGDFSGKCVANAFFPKSTITCFNDGDCNGSGKCIVCSRYRYGGMKMAISHAPPPEVLKFFGKGLSDEELRSPNLVRFPSSAANAVVQDQLPLHILVRNLQTEIAKCCHWNADNGNPGIFFLATIKNTGTFLQLVDENGKVVQVEGLVVKNSAFPDEVGTFFPVGTTVVAGWEDQPSFFLEPRTGLVKPGDGVIYSFTSGEGVNETPSTIRTKQTASASERTVTAAVNAAGFACQAASNEVSRQTDFFNNALNTNDPQTIAAATAKFTAANAAATEGCEAADKTPGVGQEAINLIGEVIGASNSATLNTKGQALAAKLTELADLVEIAGGSTTGSAAVEAARQVRQLRIAARTLSFSATGGTTRCEFFFEDNNIAKQWNSPEDGSLLCNGVRTNCDFYTGKKWKVATEEKLEIGQPTLAEQIQELRYRSEDWSRFSNPDQEFKNRFTTPFIWAFKDYVDVSGEPDPSEGVEQTLLFKSKVIGARGTSFSEYQQIRMTKVAVKDLTADTFDTSTSTARTQPGSNRLDFEGPPPFPHKVASPLISSAARLSITHPDPEGSPFIYRMWSPEKNKISLFGNASPDQTIYVINRTVLQNRNRYLSKFGEKNFFDVPTELPLAPNFNGLTATQLLKETVELLNEKITNGDTIAPLGYDQITSGRDGFWSSIEEVDLVHNKINEIFVFLIASEASVLSASTKVDCRFLHTIVGQTNFTGEDFSMLNLGGSGSKVGSNASDTAKKGEIKASPFQLIGTSTERLSFDHGYYAWRFIDRGLKFGPLNADNDLKGQNPIADQASTLLVTGAAPSEFVVNVGYHVVQYEVKDFSVSGKEGGTAASWSLLGDCGIILLRLTDPNVNRVLPLPNQQGDQTPLRDVLINGGGKGSEIAQWGLTKVELKTTTAAGASVTKELVQFYRSPDGFSLPANYVILGPGASTKDQFGRPNPEQDTLTISYKFLRAQSATQEGEEGNPDGQDLNERVPVLQPGDIPFTATDTNFHDDSIRSHKHFVSFHTEDSTEPFVFGGSGLSAANADGPTRISDDQQDYAIVFKDSEGRPLGKKYMRFYVMYYNLTCINVEIFYRWAASCTTYALIPDLLTRVGDSGGTITSAPDATDDPEDDRLSLGFRIKNLLGARDCVYQPNCGDHEIIKFGPLRREFEVIVNITEGTSDPEAEAGVDVETFQKANFPSAGGPIEGEIVSSEPPGSQFLRRHGPMWYPYNICERPRYQFNTNGPLKTDSTELINTTVRNPGLASLPAGGGIIVSNGVGSAQGGVGSGEFGALPDKSCEAYHGPDQVLPKILDVHPSLRPCTSAYTYGNQVTKAGENRFAGYARKRGEVDTFLYEGAEWTFAPFGNFGRPRINFEISSERGDYLVSKSVGRRWMPMFPTRPNVGATTGQFSEDALEHVAYRMVCNSTPVGTLSESVSTSSTSGGLTVLGAPRFSHKAIIGNKTAAAIEFPFSPYFPMFIPDGQESKGGNVVLEEGSTSLGPISTMWAWREAEKSVQRGSTGGKILRGIKLASPDYFVDNRRLEVELRPEEGNSTLKWAPPKYKRDDGTLKENASLKLAAGAAREIIVDFVNRQFQVADQEGTIYDTSQALFECKEGPSDNPKMSAQCVCISDITNETLKGGQSLPSRFLHLDELAPPGFVGLYSSASATDKPFLVDIPRGEQDDPCCMCISYVRGLFFALNGTYIPTVANINPAFDVRLEAEYTWSRVPHGFDKNNTGDDKVFNSFEQLGDVQVSFKAGDVFTSSIQSNRGSLDPLNDGGAIFPSPARAADQAGLGEDIVVSGRLDPTTEEGSRRLKGGTPTSDTGVSRGQPEQIILSMVFNTYVRVTEVIVAFYAGKGFEAPRYQLHVVPPEARTVKGELITEHTGLIIAEALESAFESDIPDPDNELEDEDIRDGTAKFVSRVTPDYDNDAFWDTYGMEWQLVFPGRGQAQSMGIASITLTVDALTEGNDNTELIGIRKRGYYRSSGTPTGDQNPERFLGEMDSATVYWRTSDQGSTKGDNRHRAYAWGGKITDDQQRVKSSNIEEMESLQEKEYDIARSLVNSPYQYNFSSFLPLDEEKWTELLAEGSSSWTTVLSMAISPVAEIITAENGTAFYGAIPKRSQFNAPGHTWTHRFDETYIPCCLGCVHSTIINYDYLHLHDNLAEVETAGFWEELPSGFTRLIRSTIMLPDPTFQGAEGGVGSTVLLNEDDFIDAQGNPIPASVLNAAGFTQDPTTGQYYIDGSEPNAAVGGPAGPNADCGT